MNGFYDQVKKLNLVKEVEVPTSLQEITVQAFCGYGIEELDLSRTQVCKIGRGAFAVSHLRKIQLPRTLKDIGCYAFEHTCLESIDLSNTQVTEIEAGLFAQCEKLSEAVLPHTVKKIHDEAFYECRALKRVDTPETQQGKEKKKYKIRPEVADWLWEGILLPDTITDVGRNAFAKTALRFESGHVTGTSYYELPRKKIMIPYDHDF